MYDDFFCEKSPDKRRQIFLENGGSVKTCPCGNRTVQLTNGSRGYRLPSAVFCAPLLKGTRIEKSLAYRQQRV